MPVLLSSLIAEKLFSEATDSLKKKTIKRGSKLKLRENSLPLGTELWKHHPALLQDHQLPGSWAWAVLLRGWFSSVLWFDVVAPPVDGAEAAGVAEEEPTPLEVLMELCWMASF